MVAQSCPTLYNPMDCSPPGSSVYGDSPSENTEVCCHFLLQGIFPTQRSNLGLPHGRQTLYPLSHQGSPSRLKDQSERSLSDWNNSKEAYERWNCTILKKFYLCSWVIWKILNERKVICTSVLENSQNIPSNKTLFTKKKRETVNLINACEGEKITIFMEARNYIQKLINLIKIYSFLFPK